MRKTALTVLLGFTLLSGAANAQPVSCFQCVLGIWDEQGLVNTSGTMTQNVAKTLWVGIKYATPQTGLTGVEFSVSGLQGLTLLGTPAVVTESIRLGTTVLSPADTSETTGGSGGLSLAWDHCLDGEQAIVKINLISFTPPPTDRVMQVKRKYPTTNPDVHTAAIFACDTPTYTEARVSGGCYVLNPSGNPIPNPCVVAVEPKTWGGVKSLYQ